MYDGFVAVVVDVVAMFGLVVRKFEILKLLKFFKSPVGHSIPYSADVYAHEYDGVCVCVSVSEKKTMKISIN